MTPPRRSGSTLRGALTRVQEAVRDRRPQPAEGRGHPPDFEPALVSLLRRVAPYSVTSPERLAAVVGATEHVVAARLPGAIVECGVWKGGSMMAAALTLLDGGVDDRELYLFDTFRGMSEPTAADVEAPTVTSTPARASETWQEINEWCAIGVDEVRDNVLSTGYPRHRLHFVEGDVQQTLPAEAPTEIALLRLDTDWYESTAHELAQLYPRLCRGGILIVDDYGHWSGARRAVDEYFGSDRPFLHRIDYTARLVVKP